MRNASSRTVRRSLRSLSRALPSVQLTVRVIPRASDPGIAGTRGGALLVRLQSPPVEGAANSELIEVLAKVFSVSKRSVTIVTGEHSKLKRVAIDGIDKRGATVALQSLGVDPSGLSDRTR